LGFCQHNRTGEGNAHLKRQVVEREAVVPVTKGEFDLGPSEQIFYCEFDGHRPKRVLVKVIGGCCHMNVKVIGRSVQPLYGQPCWGLHYERSLNLSMNFGTPSLRVREPFNTDSKSEAVRRTAARRLVTVRGEWWLWIYCCYWRLTSDGPELATGSSSFRRIERATAQLEGQELVSVEVEPETGATRFIFDLGCVLHCRRFERDTDAELWMLYKPSGYVLSVHGNGTFSRQRATEVEQRLQPIENGVRPDDR
jgi:hypothetical protein